MIVGNVVLAHIAPYHVRGPVGDRIDLYQLELVIPFDLSRRCASAGLPAANGGDPGAQLGQFLLQRFHFAKRAAQVGIAAPQFCAMSVCLLFRRQRWIDPLDTDSVALLDPVHELISLWKKKFSIKSENPKRTADVRCEINQRHTLNAETRSDRNVLTVIFKRPSKNLLGRPCLGLAAQLRNVLSGFSGFCHRASTTRSEACSCRLIALRVVAGFANRTVSPITSSVGDGSSGEL